MNDLKRELMGYFHGEGYLGISFRIAVEMKYGLSIRLRVDVGSSDLEILERFKEIYGGSISNLKKGKNNLKHFYLEGSDINNGLRRIEVFLRDLLNSNLWSRKTELAKVLIEKAIPIFVERRHLTKDGMLELAKIHDGNKKFVGGNYPRKWNYETVKSYLENPKKITKKERKKRTQIHKKWVEKNREHIRAYNRDYYHKHKRSVS